MEKPEVMYNVDPRRTDLVAEFMDQPGGPHSPELTLLVNRLRLLPMAERIILVKTGAGDGWRLARMPARGEAIAFTDATVFEDYDDACREVFRRRWQHVTGIDPGRGDQ